jgi:hypothetical protein
MASVFWQMARRGRVAAAKLELSPDLRGLPQQTHRACRGLADLEALDKLRSPVHARVLPRMPN